MTERIGVVGAGYVGLTSAACLTRLGHSVTCVDVDTSKVEELRSGVVTISEPGLPELVTDGLAAGRLSFTTSLAGLSDVDAVFLCVPTPQDDGGGADLTALDSVLSGLGDIVPADCLVAIKSTVPVGTGDRVARTLDRPVLSTPEFLREGHAVQDFLHPNRVVIGTPDAAPTERMAAVFAGVDAPVLHTNRASAELAKYASNAFLAVKVSFVNVIAELCERLNADVTEVSRVIGLDERIGAVGLAPGPGWGGSCLPKDTSALLRTASGTGVEFGILREAVAVNESQRERVVRKVRLAATGRADGSLHDVRIGLLGLTFKAGTSDLRDSPAVAVADALYAAGAMLTAYDPEIAGGRWAADAWPQLHLADDPYTVAKDAHALVLLTDWPMFALLDWSRMASMCERAVVVDTRNQFSAATLGRFGFARIGLGQPTPARNAIIDPLRHLPRRLRHR